MPVCRGAPRPPGQLTHPPRRARARRTRGRGARPLLSTATFAAAIAAAPSTSAQTTDVPGAIEVVAPGDEGVPPPKDRAVAGSVVREERLKAPGLQAADVLRTQPGVAVAETGGYGELSTASIRGATAAQTPVYLAGVRLNDDAGGTTDLSMVPLWLLHSVEIYRSNAPLEADELGIGGAIFFEPRIPKKTEAGAGALVGSFGDRGVWGFGGFGGRRGSALVGVRYETAQNDYSYVNDRGTRFDPTDDVTVTRSNADARTVDVWGIGRVRLGRGHADVLVNDTEREQGIPGLSVFPSTRARGSFTRRLVSMSSSLPCAAGDACAVTASTALLVSSSNYDDPLRDLSLGATSAELGALRASQAVRMKLRPLPQIEVAPALSASVETLGADLGDTPSLRARRLTSRGAISGSFTPTDVLSAHAMASAECNGTSADGRTPWSFPDSGLRSPTLDTCAEADPAGRVGVEVGPPAITGLANAGRYVRVPTLAEVYGISGAVRGNSELLPERGVVFDLGVRARRAPDGTVLSRSYLDLFGFVRTVEDLVAYERSGLGYVRPFNVGRARIAGAEFLGGIHPLPFVLFEVAATLLDPRDTSDNHLPNDFLPYESRLRVVPRLEVEAVPGGAVVRRVKTTATYFFESDRNADRAGTVTLPAQSSLDADVEVAMFDEHLVARARVANVLNQTRVDLVGYPLPGRAAYAALEARW